MKFKALAPVTMGVGAVIGLTAAQARGRAFMTAPIKGREGKLATENAAEVPGWFTVTVPTQFKVGEEFLHEGELPKFLAQSVELPNGQTLLQAQADQQAARQAKSKAKK